MSVNQLILEQLVVGPMANCVYFIGDKSKKEIMIVDPGWDPDYILKKADPYEVKGVLLTHGHYDHTNALSGLLSKLNVPVYLSNKELSIYIPAVDNINKIEDGHMFNVGDIAIKTIHTPGHTPGCLCFMVNNHLITGDTLFIDGCGRVDLPGGDVDQMYDTLQLIKKLPDNTVIYPGHIDESTPNDTLKNQKVSNPFLNPKNKDEFMRKRMGL